MTTTVRNLIIILFLFSLMGCGSSQVYTKAQYIQEFENFINLTDSNYQNYNEVEIDKCDLRFKELKRDFNNFSQDMTEQEKNRVDNLIGQYYACVAKFQATQTGTYVKRLYHQAKGFVENITK